MRCMVRCCVLLVWLSSYAVSQDKNTILVDRVADTGFIQLQAPSFKILDARQQQLAYWLCQASIAIDPIIYDRIPQGDTCPQFRLRNGEGKKIPFGVSG